MLGILGGILGLVAFVCYVIVVIQIFTHGETVMGLVCSLGLFCVGIGYLVALGYGWMKSGQWGIVPLMGAWTGCLIAAIVCNALQFAMNQ